MLPDIFRQRWIGARAQLSPDRPASPLVKHGPMNENRSASLDPASNVAEMGLGKSGRGNPDLSLYFVKWKPMDHEENEPKLFSLSEAEHARRQVEPLLIDAMEGRRQMGDLEESLSAIANRIQIMGGITIDYDAAARMRADLNRIVAKVKDALDQIQATGCIVKDLDSGLVDFPSLIKDEEVYLCWRLGEDRIRFYHRQDEGFSGRKPIDPEDTGPQHPIQ